MVLIFMGVLAATILVYRLERGTAGRGYKWFLRALRVLVIAVALIILFEPIRSTEWREVREATTVLLLDDSQSMTLRDIYEEEGAKMPEELGKALNWSEEDVRTKTRKELVLRALEAARHGGTVLERLLDKNRLRVYTFSGETPRLIADVDKKAREIRFVDEKEGVTAYKRRLSDYYTCKGEETRLIDSLNAVLNDMRGQKVAAVIVVSDGQDTAHTVLPEYVTEAAKRRRIPIHTVGVGTARRPKDIQLVALDARDAILKGDQTSFSVKIKSEGFEQRDVDLILEFGGEEVVRKRVRLRGKGAVQVETLYYTPNEPGDYQVVLKIPVQKGEQFERNNSLLKKVVVVDKKIRVLYMEGAPRWEYRYLKNALIRDPTMEVHCILQEADDGFRQESSPHIDPIGRFPETRDELMKYHVIIIGDANPHHIKHGFKPEQLEMIKQFVDLGGGFIMIAGENYSPGRYANTPVEEILPVIPERLGATGTWQLAGTYNRVFHLRLTPEGKSDQSKIMRLLDDPEKNIEFWEDNNRNEEDSLPGLFWYSRVERAKRTAIVLAVHPTERDAKGKERPVIVLGRYGRGTTLFVGVDETWRWRFGVGDIYFYRFWSQAIRYLALPALLGKGKRYTLHTDRENYNVGQTVTVSAYILDRDFKPLNEPEQVATIRLPDGKPIQLRMKLDPKNPGNYAATFETRNLGLHDVWLGGPEVDPKTFALSHFTVEMPSLETKNPQINEKLLKALAEGTDGAYVPLHRIHEIPKKVEGIEEVVAADVREEPLWDKWWILLLFVGLITVEWVARRLRRLL